MRIMLIVLAFMLVSSAAFALHPDDVLKDPILESRARAITHQVRCLVCQGESIDESGAALAGDLRRLVRARLQAGDSDDQVIAYLTARYGDAILMRPPFSPSTLLLWLAPFAVLGAAGFAIWRRQRQAGEF